jgi:hypothetical protein
MFLTTALAAMTVLQEPAEAPKQSPAKAALMKSLEKFQGAAAMKVDAQLNIHIDLEAIGMPVDEGAKGLQKVGSAKSTMKWAKPGFGSINIDGSMEFLGQEQELRIETLGTADGMFQVDHAEKTWEGPVELGEVMPPWYDFVPMSGFLTGKTELPKDLKELEKGEGQEGMHGWTWNTPDGKVHLWMKDGKPASYALVTENPENEQVVQKIEIKFASVELIAELEDPKTWATKIPEGYEELSYEDFGGAADFESELLAVGDVPPAVAMTDMDGNEVTLASLEGKTILMNFWFFH